MNEIKIENNINVVCHGCLSTDRRTASLGILSDVFLNLIGSRQQTMIYAVEDIKLCWECSAVLRKFKVYQNQMASAQNVLMQMLYDLDFSPVSLSKLTTFKRCHYDHEYQYAENTKKKLPKHDTFIQFQIPKENEHESVDVQVEIENIDSIKEESYSEYDSYVDDNDQNETNNKNEFTDDKNEFNNKNEFTDDKTEFTNGENIIKDIYQNSTNENELDIPIEAKMARSKRRKLVKSRDNSVSYYKQYTTLIDREKIDWGKVEDYFTKINFGEAEMEEHFLSKERKFSEYSRFKYKCVQCELGFMRSFDLKRHNNLNHNKKGEFKCSVCQKTVASAQALDAHWREHTPIAKCNMCGDVCRPRGMKNHLNYAHTKKYACQFCNMKFGKIKHFSVHYKEMHQNYICDYCNACCKTKILVQKHIRTHHTKFTCKECNRQYPNYRQYKRHINELHPNRASDRPELAYCVECDKQYASVTKYKKHLKISPKHTEIKRIILPCPECGKIFRRKNYLNNHYNLYHAKKSKHYCELCDKYFSNGYGLRKHKMHVHLKVSRVKDKMCDLCGRGFTTNRILMNHRRTHTGERPYQCPFCSAAFTQKQAMQSHCRTQHKDVK